MPGREDVVVEGESGGGTLDKVLAILMVAGQIKMLHSLKGNQSLGDLPCMVVKEIIVNFAELSDLLLNASHLHVID